jgi:hypothetical protein
LSLAAEADGCFMAEIIIWNSTECKVAAHAFAPPLGPFWRAVPGGTFGQFRPMAGSPGFDRDALMLRAVCPLAVAA